MHTKLNKCAQTGSHVTWCDAKPKTPTIPQQTNSVYDPLLWLKTPRTSRPCQPCPRNPTSSSPPVGLPPEQAKGGAMLNLGHCTTDKFKAMMAMFSGNQLWLRRTNCKCIGSPPAAPADTGRHLSLIHIGRCRRSDLVRSRGAPHH